MTATATEILDVASWNTSLRTATATGKTVIVDFHATWCGPCKQIAPHYNNLAAQFKQVVFLRVDVDNLKQIAAKYQITAMPTFLAIQSGKVVDTIKGADPRALSAMVARHAGPRIPVPPLDKEAEHKRLEGNAFFKAGNFSAAIESYTAAILLAPKSHILPSNRSLSHLRLTPPNYTLALQDAVTTTTLQPGFGKGWIRVGEAKEGLQDLVGAKEAFERAWEVEEGKGTVAEEAKKKLEEVARKINAAA